MLLQGLPSLKTSISNTPGLQKPGVFAASNIRFGQNNAVLSYLETLPDTNAVGMESPSREDFAAVINQKADALNTAKHLREVLDEFPLNTPEGRTALFKLISRPDVEDFSAIQELTKDLKDRGIPVKFVADFLTDLPAFLERNGNSIKSLGKVVAAVPAQNVPAHLRAGVFLELRKRYSEITFTALSLDGVVEKAFQHLSAMANAEYGELNSIIDRYSAKPPAAKAAQNPAKLQEAFDAWKNFMAIGSSFQEVDESVSRLSKALNLAGSNGKLKEQYFRLCKSIQTMSQLPVLFKLVEACQPKEDKEAYLLEPLVAIANDSKLPADQLAENLKELPAALQQFRSSGDGIAFRNSLQRVWREYGAKLGKNLVPLASRVTEMTQALDGLLDYEQTKLIMTLLKKKPDPDALLGEIENAIQPFQNTPEARQRVLREFARTGGDTAQVQSVVNLFLQFSAEGFPDSELKSLTKLIDAFTLGQYSADARMKLFDTITADVKQHKNLKILEEVAHLMTVYSDPRSWPHILQIALESPPDARKEGVRLLAKYANYLFQFDNLQPESFSYSSAYPKLLRHARLISKIGKPTDMLNYYLMNRENIDPRAAALFFRAIEYDMSVPDAKKLLPELLAMVTPIQESLKNKSANEIQQVLDQVASGLTRVYDFLYGSPQISRIEPIVLNTWAKVGTQGLSFPKWQFDSMTRWKGQGPMQQSSLFEQSGLFKKVPPRENDAKYHGGFLHYDPATGVSVELRRAYIVISKPGLGTLVIRNSSQLFGRNLLPEPAYYSPEKLYTDETNLFNPDKDLPELTMLKQSSDPSKKFKFDEEFFVKDPKQFRNVFGRALNIKAKQQQQNHEQIDALLTAFEKAMEPYAAWKCSFKNGKPPEGFREMLQTSLMSARNDGAISPFGSRKNVRLAWVNPYALPFAVRSFDVTNPAHQLELDFYLKVLTKKVQVTAPEEYARKLPNLLPFLKEGMEKGWELVLTE